ncbi:MAG: hypothetical protein QNJ12_19090, partial [Ilumatobacter sp.]|uniref:hypothetical protein n=1 Tax=Ilumatobacter sp. TaxID=1967498 RepID=UPI002624313C
APAFLAGEPLPAPPAPPERGEIEPAELLALAGRYEVLESDLPVADERGEVDDGGRDGDVGADIDIAIELPGDGFDIVAVGDGTQGTIEVTAIGPIATATLFPPEDDEQAAAMADHEALVRSLLAGETQEGRAELALIEAELGPVSSVRLIGTVWAGFEFRTYVEALVGGATVDGWYALDERGGVAGAELGSRPTLQLVLTSEGTFRPNDPMGAAADVSIVFNGETMTVNGPDGSTTARRAP